jgi:hypothetical protein
MTERPDMEGPWLGGSEWATYSLGGAVKNRWDHLVPPEPEPKPEPGEHMGFSPREERKLACTLWCGVILVFGSFLGLTAITIAISLALLELFQ